MEAIAIRVFRGGQFLSLQADGRIRQNDGIFREPFYIVQNDHCLAIKSSTGSFLGRHDDACVWCQDESEAVPLVFARPEEHSPACNIVIAAPHEAAGLQLSLSSDGAILQWTTSGSLWSIDEAPPLGTLSLPWALQHRHGKEVCLWSGAEGGWITAHPAKMLGLGGQVTSGCYALNPWEKYTLQVVPAEDRVCLRGCHGSLLSANPSGAVMANKKDRGQWESFILEEVQGTCLVRMRTCHGTVVHTGESNVRHLQAGSVISRDYRTEMALMDGQEAEARYAQKCPPMDRRRAGKEAQRISPWAIAGTVAASVAVAAAVVGGGILAAAVISAALSDKQDTREVSTEAILSRAHTDEDTTSESARSTAALSSVEEAQETQHPTHASVPVVDSQLVPVEPEQPAEAQYAPVEPEQPVEASQSAHMTSDQQGAPLQVCCICKDQVTEGLHCLLPDQANRHFHCHDCLEQYAVSDLGATQVLAGSLRCSMDTDAMDNHGQDGHEHRCTAPPWTMADLSAAISREAMVRLFQAASTALTTLRDTVERQRVQIATAGDARTAELERRLQEAAGLDRRERLARMRQDIIEAVCYLRCPRCSAVYVDFDGCAALTCSRPGCAAAFCAVCLTDCGTDAHPHCRTEHGNVFMTIEAVNEAHKRRRQAMLQAVIDDLRRQGQDVAFSRELLQSMAADMRDIGLDTETVALQGAPQVRDPQVDAEQARAWVEAAAAAAAAEERRRQRLLQAEQELQRQHEELLRQQQRQEAAYRAAQYTYAPAVSMPVQRVVYAAAPSPARRAATGGTYTGQRSPQGHALYQGPRGGVYHISSSGNKVYHSRK